MFLKMGSYWLRLTIKKYGLWYIDQPELNSIFSSVACFNLFRFIIILKVLIKKQTQSKNILNIPK